ncbi:MAG: tetratricopeptide repeat protein [Acidobacteria bacterium]|nr:tetratricopeptide repeat protein [Acidobacteriota bacterium]MCI0719463.1 tetratricopeptide repeat protein [Acidobacteriota bacterium]
MFLMRLKIFVICGLGWSVLLGALSLGNERPGLSGFNHEELLGRADRAFRMRNFLAAEKYYRELDRRLALQLSKLPPSDKLEQIEIEEELILAPFGLGHSLIYLHRYSEALEALERGLKTYPDWANSHPSLVFFQDPLFTGPVVSDLEEKMKVSPDPVHWLVHGYIQFFSENFRQASRSFSHALSADKGSFMAGYFSGQIPIAQRKTESAKLQEFKELDADKLEPDALIDYGSSFFKNADYQTAAKLFKRAIDLDQKLPVVHIAYGDSLFALGRFDEATQAILTGLEIYPKYAENPINRREFYNNPSEFDRQLRNLENYVNSHPSNLNARFLLGYNYFFTQAYEKAEEQLEAVLSSESLHSSAQYLQGLIQRFNTQKNRKAL